MRNVITALALLIVVGLNAAPALADCIYDMQHARQAVYSMPEGRAKQIAERELRMAMEAALTGDEKMCLVHVALSIARTCRLG